MGKARVLNKGGEGLRKKRQIDRQMDGISVFKGDLRPRNARSGYD